MAEMQVSIQGLVPANGAMPVSGSITTTPSGTQVVSGTVTTVPSGTQTVAGTVTTVPSGTQTVSGTVNTLQNLPAGANAYLTSVSGVAGLVTTPYNFLSLFNPSGSGKSIYVLVSEIIPWATATTIAANSMETFRITAASAGTQITAANIGKFISSSPNSIAEVRTTNPTVTTTGLTLGGVPPSIVLASGAVTGAGNSVVPLNGQFVLAPGEGLCMRQVVAGTTVQVWNLGYVWFEL